jgi:hypothetical protein
MQQQVVVRDGQVYFSPLFPSDIDEKGRRCGEDCEEWFVDKYVKHCLARCIEDHSFLFHMMLRPDIHIVSTKCPTINPSYITAGGLYEIGTRFINDRQVKLFTTNLLQPPDNIVAYYSKREIHFVGLEGTLRLHAGCIYHRVLKSLREGNMTISAGIEISMFL